MNYVLFPIAHGVEFSEIQQDYAIPLIDKIRSHLNDSEKNYLVPLPYNYTIKTHSRQMLMYESVERGLGNQKLRKLKHIMGSDVTWSFIVAKENGECFYMDFVRVITGMLERGLRLYPGAKIACLGHSQGTQLFYSFLFDFPKPVDLFISMGSPISMNSGAYADFGKIPKDLGCWINFYHDLDFVSSRLQGVHPSKAISEFVIDYRVPNGLNPLYHLPQFIFRVQLYAAIKAHVGYWTSDFVANLIAENIKQLIYMP